MPQLVGLALTSNVARDPTRILDLLVAVEDLPDGLRLVSGRMPEMHGENERVAARVIVEDALGRRVGENAPSQYNSPSMRTAGKAGGSAPEAMMWLGLSVISFESK